MSDRNTWESAYETLAAVQAAVFAARKVVAGMTNSVAAEVTEDFQFESLCNIAGNLARSHSEVSEAMVYASHVLGE